MKSALAAALVLLVPSVAHATTKPTKYPWSAGPTRLGDARFPAGDIVSSSVAIKGDGLVFTWTTSKAPFLLVPGDRIWGFTGAVKTAKFTIGPLTTGEWRMTVNYGPIDGHQLGTDDTCGQNDSDQLS